jgi:hypothetical protein
MTFSMLFKGPSLTAITLQDILLELVLSVHTFRNSGPSRSQPTLLDRSKLQEMARPMQLVVEPVRDIELELVLHVGAPFCSLDKKSDDS